MLRILLLVLIVFSSIFFAQAQEKPEAYKFFEYGKISNRLLNDKYREYFSKLKNDGDLRGYIVNDGNDKEIAKREKQIRDVMKFVCED